MAVPAIDGRVATCEWEIGFAVIKMQGIGAIIHARHARDPGSIGVKLLPVSSINLPSSRIVAGGAIDFHIRAMRILGEEIRRENQALKEEHISGQNRCVFDG